mmetsp:Transcript_12810/g.23280  ORF Transcript_12810/g.23280 Transcript_12810/m.23280 type:complete len:290 (-) Transcript_12810:579-1448(-)
MLHESVELLKQTFMSSRLGSKFVQNTGNFLHQLIEHAHASRGRLPAVGALGQRLDRSQRRGRAVGRSTMGNNFGSLEFGGLRNHFDRFCNRTWCRTRDSRRSSSSRSNSGRRSRTAARAAACPQRRKLCQLRRRSRFWDLNLLHKIGRKALRNSVAFALELHELFPSEHNFLPLCDAGLLDGPRHVRTTDRVIVAFRGQIAAVEIFWIVFSVSLLVFSLFLITAATSVFRLPLLRILLLGVRLCLVVVPIFLLLCVGVFLFSIVRTSPDRHLITGLRNLSVDLSGLRFV